MEELDRYRGEFINNDLHNASPSISSDLMHPKDGEDKVAERGDSIAVVADGGKNKAVTFEDSDRGVEEELDDNIEYVSCRCGNQGGCVPFSV